jgi:hypothetical protein
MNDTCELCQTRARTIGAMCEECVKFLSAVQMGWAEQIMKWTDPTFRRDQNEPVYPLVRLH